MEKKMKYAPIILFVYKRLDHVRQVLDALLQNPEVSESTLIIYADAAKTSVDEKGVQEVRDYLKTLTGFANIHIIEREVNWGIEKSEIAGITEVLEHYGRAIILEDDIQVGPAFLSFMNAALEKYEDDERIFSVTGYSFIKEEQICSKLPEYAFIQLTSAWGWGTWKTRWKYFSKHVSDKALLKLCKHSYREKFNHGYFYADMLLSQYKEGYITWDILWYWTVFQQNGLTLAPVRTMVNNIGMDGSGVHYTDKQGKNRIECLEHCAAGSLPDLVEENPEIRGLIEKELKQLLYGKQSALHMLLRKVRTMIQWILIYVWLKRKAMDDEQQQSR